MRRFLPFAALLGVAFLLGCQDLGSGPVGPQFHVSEKHPNGHGGGGEGGTTTFVAAITNDDFSGTLTTLTTEVDNKFNTGNSIAMDPIDVLGDGSLILDHFAFSVRKR